MKILESEYIIAITDQLSLLILLGWIIQNKAGGSKWVVFTKNKIRREKWALKIGLD